jgi:DNA-binding IclR family transcriptional regulator
MKINSVDKAITVLNCFSKQEPILGVGNISKMTGYTPSVVSRMLSTLESRGVVEKAPGHGRYQMGYRIYFWGILSRINNNLVKLAQPFMEELRDKCGEEVSLYIVVDNHRTCLQRVPSKHGIAMTGSIGDRMPLHAGASGQVLLAYMDQKRRQEIIENKTMETYTDKTLVNPIELSAKLDKIREQGYGISLEEREPGAYSIVAPVRDVSGRVIASLSLAGPVYRLDETSLETHTERVRATAGLISRKVGFTPTKGRKKD